MTVVSIPKRKMSIEIEGKVFEASELSLAYLTEAMVNPESDTMDAAIADAMPGLTEEDYRLFGAETKQQIYAALVKFTFREPVTAEKRKLIMKETGLSEAETKQLSREAILQLNSIVEARKPDPMAAAKKKTSSRRSPE